MDMFIMNNSEVVITELRAPTKLEIVLPPIAFMLLILAGLLILSIITQPSWWHRRICPNKLQCWRPSKCHYCRHKKAFGAQTSHFGKASFQCVTADFLSDRDLTTLMRITEFHNNPMSLIIISIPALASLAMCPFAIWVYTEWGYLFWPSHDDTHRMPDINDAIANFLMPAGLVYAIAFGFAYQDVQTKTTKMVQVVHEQTTVACQTWQLIKCTTSISISNKRLLARDIKDSLIHWMENVLNIQVDNEGSLWHAVQTLCSCKVAESCHDLEKDIMTKILDNLIVLDKCLRDNHQNCHRNITVVQWLFLELLGFISFFGILMVKAGSYRLELTMCILTVFSISAFSYILADLDSLFHGVFHICLLPSVHFIESLNNEMSLEKSRQESVNGTHTEL